MPSGRFFPFDYRKSEPPTSYMLNHVIAPFLHAAREVPMRKQRAENFPIGKPVHFLYVRIVEKFSLCYNRSIHGQPCFLRDS